jgi:hypothetical protein
VEGFTSQGGTSLDSQNSSSEGTAPPDSVGNLPAVQPGVANVLNQTTDVERSVNHLSNQVANDPQSHDGSQAGTANPIPNQIETPNIPDPYASPATVNPDGSIPGDPENELSGEPDNPTGNDPTVGPGGQLPNGGGC